MNYYNQPNFSDLKDKILSDIEIRNYRSEVIFTTRDGEKYRLYHWQDGCESVHLEDIIGDLSDLIGRPLLLAEEISSYQYPEDIKDPNSINYYESFTWTFYKLATERGYVTLRWLGTSNGYYSESVDFEKITE